MSFTLTYASMANPPEIFHTSYETALEELKAQLGKDYPLIIGAEKRFKNEKFTATSPINSDWQLASFQKGDAQDANDAIAAAKAAFPAWSALPWQERVQHVRDFANAVQERIFEMGAAVSLDVGKNRMEAWQMCKNRLTSCSGLARKWKSITLPRHARQRSHGRRRFNERKPHGPARCVGRGCTFQLPRRPGWWSNGQRARRW